MKKNVIIAAVVALGLLLIATFVSPSFRTYVLGKAETVGQWTPDAIERDPVGYSNFVERQLKKDLETYKANRRDLGIAMNDLAKKLTDKTKFLDQGQKLADEFAEAIEKNEFPAVVRSKEYTESQMRLQLTLTLAEIDGLTESLTEIEKISKLAEQENLKIVVQLEKTESQLSLLATRRQIFKSRQLTDEGSNMIATCNAVLEENQAIFKDNPVRTIQQLIDDTDENVQNARVSDERVEQFLKDYSAKKGGGKKNEFLETENVPEEPAQVQD